MNELDRSRVSKEVRSFLDRRRPAAHVRPKLDYTFRFYKQSVELIEVRPRLNDPTKKSEHAFAIRHRFRDQENCHVETMHHGSGSRHREHR